MSIEEAIDSYYIINELFKEEKNPFQFEHIYKCKPPIKYPYKKESL